MVRANIVRKREGGKLKFQMEAEMQMKVVLSLLIYLQGMTSKPQEI